MKLLEEKHAAEMRVKELELQLAQKEAEQSAHLVEAERRIADECRNAAEQALVEKEQAEERSRTVKVRGEMGGD